MAVKEGKVLNIRIPEDIHKSLKLEAVRRDRSVKDMVIDAIKNFIRLDNDVLEHDDEPLTEEDLKDIEQSEKDIQEGNTITLEDYKKQWK